MDTYAKGNDFPGIYPVVLAWTSMAIIDDRTGSTSPPSDGLLQRASRPCYSVVDAAFDLLVAAAFICRQFRRQRDELAAAAFRSLAAGGHAASALVRYFPTTEPIATTTKSRSIGLTRISPCGNRPWHPTRELGVNYLEVGLYSGRSASGCSCTPIDPTSRLTGIEIFDGELKQRFFDNLYRSGRRTGRR